MDNKLYVDQLRKKIEEMKKDIAWYDTENKTFLKNGEDVLMQAGYERALSDVLKLL